ncbi:restriction modification enzyme [Yersinia frederiksenii]|nr:restriction modification enzyme [Yersinia frederiksenii]
MIPEGWLISTLDKFIDIKHGFAFKSDYFRSEGEYILTTPGHFFEVGGFRDQGNKTKYYVGEVPKGYLLKKGDVLLAMTEQAAGLLGSAIYVPESGKYLHNQRLGLVIVRDHERICKEYIYLIYNSPTTRKTIAEQASGTKVKHTSPSRLLGVKVLIPPLSEQKKIAQVLSTWDKAIATTEQLLANSQLQKKALMQKIFTGRDRFSEFTEKWKSHELSDIAMVQMGSSPKSGAYNEDGYGLPLIQGNADIKNRRSAPRIFTAEITKECDVGDILLSVRAPVGTVAVSSHKACIGRGISAIRATMGFNQDFLYQWFLWFEPRWGALSQGSTFESINSDDIKQLKIELPDLEEQKKIASVLSNADQEIEVLQQKLHHLKQEKKALMQQLLTGKRRVKVDAA